MGKPPKPTPVFHITHLDNLPSILEYGGLLSSNRMDEEDVDCKSVAYDNIQAVRATTAVDCGPGGTLHDYVPFMFGPRSPMLFTINKGNVTTCPEGQGMILHLVSSIESIVAEEVDYVFTDGHAIMALSNFYDSPAGLRKVDWNLMTAIYWFDSNQFPDRKRRRQAEFLASDFVPWNAIDEIGVINKTVAKIVESELNDAGVNTPVRVLPSWYY